MLKEIAMYVKGLFETHTNRKVGFVAGLAVGAFALVCGVIGLYIGARFDDGDDLIARTLKALEEVLPERFQRW